MKTILEMSVNLFKRKKVKYYISTQQQLQPRVFLGMMQQALDT